MPTFGSTLRTSTSLIVSGSNSGLRSSTSAAAPATIGADIEVPLRCVYPSTPRTVE